MYTWCHVAQVGWSGRQDSSHTPGLDCLVGHRSKTRLTTFRRDSPLSDISGYATKHEHGHFTLRRQDATTILLPLVA
ncbi:hypothetical protein E2C01_000131 [Portunus trituberculatus]|uniref:Uncharacterized protein n=1 Tax=Portunus trituberculatus TaxID=210409 RepID=A0A5B7CDT8_PORTR|nr:hypothetical protein [Portunus trituberculatus]